MTWMIVVGAALLFAEANWRMIRAAFATDPHCVAHQRLDAGRAAHDGSYTAAQSACSPKD